MLRDIESLPHQGGFAIQSSQQDHKRTLQIESLEEFEHDFKLNQAIFDEGREPEKVELQKEFTDQKVFENHQKPPLAQKPSQKSMSQAKFQQS